MQNLNLDKVPSNIHEAIDMLYEGLSEEDRQFVLTHDSAEIHHGPGTSLRNGWSLWDRDTILVQWCIKNLQIGHADDISGLMFHGLWQKVHGEPIELQSEIDSYHKHWHALGVDPITQKHLETT